MSNIYPQSQIMQFFGYSHLPENLQVISKPFHDMAVSIDSTLPVNAEKSTCLRKLLEAKDCAIRSVVYKDLPVGLGSEGITFVEKAA